MSEELAAADVDAFTWLAVAGEIGAGALLAIVGLGVVRANGFALRAQPGWA